MRGEAHTRHALEILGCSSESLQKKAGKLYADCLVVGWVSCLYVWISQVRVEVGLGWVVICNTKQQFLLKRNTNYKNAQEDQPCVCCCSPTYILTVLCLRYC